MQRQAIAILALLGVFLAGYLTLYHYGYLGSLACGTGGCEKVQTSKYAMFMGLPVALWGVGYYATAAAIAIAGSVGSGPERAWPTTALLVLNGWGVAFSSYLTWLELARIHAICRYCVVSAAAVAVLFGLSAWDWRARASR
ncbi:MAG: vitamin K epoxide reductase family protein [Gemmatimonadaceae bacterium]|nr:vitamin K epoxide reductase family protein [Gemmatimonadaceae bacterium]